MAAGGRLPLAKTDDRAGIAGVQHVDRDVHLLPSPPVSIVVVQHVDLPFVRWRKVIERDANPEDGHAARIVPAHARPQGAQSGQDGLVVVDDGQMVLAHP